MILPVLRQSLRGRGLAMICSILVSLGGSAGFTLGAEAAGHGVLLSAEKAALFFDRVAAQMGEVHSFSAAFTQEHHLSVFLDVLTANGVSYFQSPDQFRWELYEPYRSVLVYNSDRVAKFEERDGTLRYVESGAYDAIRGLMGQLTNWMRGDFRATRDGFTQRVFEGLDYEIELTPRSATMLQYIQHIEVHLRKDPIQVSRIVIREPEEDYIEIRFEVVRENASLRPELFDTSRPLVTSPLP